MTFRITHSLLRVNYIYLSGLNVEMDFVETPSQMLENWVWQKESLKLMSKHYKNGSEIDEKLIDDLISSKNAMAGFNNLRFILTYMLDNLF